jgi:hypothetical protein
VPEQERWFGDTRRITDNRAHRTPYWCTPGGSRPGFRWPVRRPVTRSRNPAGSAKPVRHVARRHAVGGDLCTARSHTPQRASKSRMLFGAVIASWPTNKAFFNATPGSCAAVPRPSPETCMRDAVLQILGCFGVLACIGMCSVLVVI